VAATEVKQAERLAYREALPESESGPPVLLVHGFPESSYMWRELLPAIAAAGRRAVAPDLLGYGDSPPDSPATWERQMEALEEFRDELGLERSILVVHDWGGLIGLRWACEHPDAVAGLVLSNTGFFPEGRWHGMAKTFKTPGEGEEAVANINRELFGAFLSSASPGFDDAAIDEYFKLFETDEGRKGPLELYRSGDFEKIAAYDGQLAALGVPTLILWGENDEFAPVAGAYRFSKEIPGSKLAIVEGAGHFVYADDPERCAREVVGFLRESAA
jgi:haloalkane dehalogenase